MHWRALFGLSLALAAAPALAVGKLVDLEVYDATAGTRLPVYRHDGRYYVAGEPGHEYRLALASRAGGRVLAVASVDGVNVLSGATAAPDQSGYVLGPYQGFDILGWRKSLERVASFYFTRLGDSYAARTGRPDNVGVIGVALFEEKQVIVPPPVSMAQPPAADRLSPAAPAEKSAPAAGGRAEASSNAAARAESPLGTGHGRSQDSVVTTTGFERATAQPAETIVVYYDSRANLVAAGVIPHLLARRGPPNPFPDGFVPDP